MLKGYLMQINHEPIDATNGQPLNENYKYIAEGYKIRKEWLYKILLGKLNPKQKEISNKFLDRKISRNEFHKEITEEEENREKQNKIRK